MSLNFKLSNFAKGHTCKDVKRVSFAWLNLNIGFCSHFILRVNPPGWPAACSAPVHTSNPQPRKICRNGKLHVDQQQ